jgi:hypothetical protein
MEPERSQTAVPAARQDTHVGADRDGANFVQGTAVPLFKTGLTGIDAYRLEFVPSADGKRILVSTPINDGARPAITVVMNWPALLKK